MIASCFVEKVDRYSAAWNCDFEELAKDTDVGYKMRDTEEFLMP
jgi:hypothetical protein